MKIKSIAAICKKNKQVVLFNRYSDSGTLSQYIGDGSAVYPKAEYHASSWRHFERVHGIRGKRSNITTRRRDF